MFLLATMANFALFSLLEWLRLRVHILQCQWEEYAQFEKTKIYHWYAFTNGTIHNWYRFTVQSVEALFQISTPQPRPPFSGASMIARHRAYSFLVLVVVLFACTKSECTAKIDLPRTWNARGLAYHKNVYFRASFFSHRARLRDQPSCVRRNEGARQGFYG